MTSDYTIFAVDDDEIVRTIVESMLSGSYSVETFDSCESCLERLASRAPDLFLLDVKLPGMSGYELCKTIKSRPEIKNIPVVFLSGQDRPSDIMAGYEAGGEDFIVKPFNPIILNRQIENLRRVDEERKLLEGKAQSTEEMTEIVLANLDEYAVLIKFLRQLNECNDPRSLLDAMFSLLKGYRLDTAIQLRLPDTDFTASAAGVNRPLEVAVMNNVRSMGRVFEFKQRAVFNFDAITVMINAMPVDDPEVCGRIRDNVLIAAECANAKLQAQLVSAENAQSKATAAELLGSVQTALADFERRSLNARYQGSERIQHLLDQLTRAFASLGLSEEQEGRIDSIVRTETNKLADIYDFSDDLQAAFSVISKRLTEIQRPHISTDLKSSDTSHLLATANTGDSSNLF